MINMDSVFIANGSAVLLLTIVLLSTKRNFRNSLVDEQLFYLMVASTMFQCIVETITLWLDGKTNAGFRETAILLNAFLFSNNILFAFLWTIYADYKLFEDIKRLKKYYPFVAIPAIVICIASIVNLGTPVFFSISADNVYSRTVWYFIPFACTYFYLAYGVILIYRYKNKVNKYLFLPALLFMVPILLGSAIQFLFYGVSLIWLGVAIALVTLFVNVQNEVSYIDNLSGLFTRQYMNMYIGAESKRINPQKRMGGIMLDIDRFKSVNDQFGHLTGDDAIRSAGKILLAAVPANAIVFRYAGDEFMVILQVSDEQEVKEAMKKIEEETVRFNTKEKRPYKIHFSQGYTLYDRRIDTMDTFLSRVDTAMYKEKNLLQNPDTEHIDCCSEKN